MGRVRVKYNHLPAVIRALPREMEQEVGDSADDLKDAIYPRLREREGYTRDTDEVYVHEGLHAMVGVGQPGGKAFYVRFWEWGTSVPNKFGIIVPAEAPVGSAAHEFEPVFASNMSRAVVRACRAR